MGRRKNGRGLYGENRRARGVDEDTFRVIGKGEGDGYELPAWNKDQVNSFDFVIEIQELYCPRSTAVTPISKNRM